MLTRTRVSYRQIIFENIPTLLAKYGRIVCVRKKNLLILQPLKVPENQTDRQKICTVTSTTSLCTGVEVPEHGDEAKSQCYEWYNSTEIWNQSSTIHV